MVLAGFSLSLSSVVLARFFHKELAGPKFRLRIKSGSWDGTVLRLSWSWPGGLVGVRHLLAIRNNTRSDSAFPHVVEVTYRWRQCPRVWQPSNQTFGHCLFYSTCPCLLCHCLHCVNSESFLVPNFRQKFGPNKFSRNILSAIPCLKFLKICQTFEFFFNYYFSHNFVQTN